MSLRRIVKKVGKVVKAAAPIAASFIPGIGGVVASAVASRVTEKAVPQPSAPPVSPGPTKTPTSRRLGIASQVIGGLSDLARARQATTPQQAVSADVEPRVMRARRVGSMRTRLLESAAPEQFDAVTPLGEAQSAALPPRRISTGARPVSIASSAGRILGALTGQLSDYAAARGGGQRGLSMSGSALRSRSLVALPGAGFTTAGGFGTTSSGQFMQFGQRRRRRMNPTNVHALRRSLRRVESFVKLEKRVDKAVNRLSRSRGRANRSGFVRRKR